MNTENQDKFLEVPEVVPNAAPVDFPEISDYLKNMKIRGSLFGFQKEDVYAKMQELNRLYQERMQQLREQGKGQIRQIRRQQQEELEAMRSLHRQEKEELEAALAGKMQELEAARVQAEQDLEQEKLIKKQEIDALRAKMEEGLTLARIQIREEQELKNREAAEKKRQGLLGIREDLSRMVDHLAQLRGRISSAAGEVQDKK